MVAKAAKKIKKLVKGGAIGDDDPLNFEFTVLFAVIIVAVLILTVALPKMRELGESVKFTNTSLLPLDYPVVVYLQNVKPATIIEAESKKYEAKDLPEDSIVMVEVRDLTKPLDVLNPQMGSRGELVAMEPRIFDLLAGGILRNGCVQQAMRMGIYCRGEGCNHPSPYPSPS